MKFNLIAPAFAALAIALAVPVTATAKDCSKIEDKKERKSCEKKAKAQAKADARSTPFVPSTLSPELAAWDGDNNPFATDEYRVRVTTTEIASVDDYLGKAFRMQAIVVGSKFIVDEIGKGNADAAKAAPALLPLLAEVPELGKSLVDEGQGLVTSLPQELAGPDALKLPKVLPALKDGVAALKGSVEEAPKVLSSLKSAVNVDAAGAAATAATSGDGENACNPCGGGENAANPCGGGENPCNPCGG